MIDVAVVGAGVAGLAAAAGLHAAGYQVRVFEARNRIGGRVFTHRDPRLPLPIELGAEFIHGEAKRTRRLLGEATLAAIDLGGEQWHAQSGKLRPADEWTRIERVLRRAGRMRNDQPFSEFLEQRVPSLADARAAARFVQGFHGADLDRVSTRSAASGNLDSVLRLGRVVFGYDAIPRWLARDLGKNIRLETEVVEIRWEPGRVELAVRAGSAGTKRVLARAAVLTFPLGVLEAALRGDGRLRIDPFPPGLRRAMEGMAMGWVTRLVIWFDEFPWRAPSRLPKNADPRRVGFIHLARGPFNVCWTAYPLEFPLAVAWCGGTQAAELGGRPVSEIAGIALASLAAHLGISARRVKSRVRGMWMHDWTADPFARGAYSFTRVHGTRSANALAKPVASTLFVAGEATDPEASGTVEGALASGERAAAQVTRSFRRRSSNPDRN